MGASAKGWIRHEDGLYLHKVGKYEIPADEILTALKIPHVPYMISSQKKIKDYLSEERKEWLEDAGEVMVWSKLITSEETALVTFEEFRMFCAAYRLNPYKEAQGVDEERYLEVQIADYILNNDDRHEQNGGFLMDNETGKLFGFCPLLDHDHAFSGYETVYSQTAEQDITLEEAARKVQKKLGMGLEILDEIDIPSFLTKEQWEKVLERKRKLAFH